MIDPALPSRVSSASTPSYSRRGMDSQHWFRGLGVGPARDERFGSASLVSLAGTGGVDLISDRLNFPFCLFLLDPEMRWATRWLVGKSNHRIY